MEFKCPGAFKIREPKPEIIKCPACFYAVEIWSDEIKARCPKCNSTVVREIEQSCLDWCRYAKECVGEDIYKRYLKNRLEQEERRQ
jgi:uncharacterized paraquat-inducible protein A